MFLPPYLPDLESIPTSSTPSPFGRMSKSQYIRYLDMFRLPYIEAMKAVSKKFKGVPGVVLHIGDSITYASPYTAWMRSGSGRTDSDKEILKWMHAGSKNEKDGLYLASLDHPDGGRSETASSGMRADQLLAGGHNGLPPYEKILAKYRPQMIVLMIGTNDVSADRKLEDYLADMKTMITKALDSGTIVILSTIPPHPQKTEKAKEFAAGLRKLAEEYKIPLIDYEQEILNRRPKDWNGTLLGKNDVHPTASLGRVSATSEPTQNNLCNNGYLLRGWLSLKKIAEVKAAVLDPIDEK